MEVTLSKPNDTKVTPGRTLVPGIGTLTEYVSSCLDRELQPLLSNTPHYIKDTTEFFEELSRIDNLPDNTTLVTLEVTALYFCIPHNDSIGTVSNIEILERYKLSPAMTFVNLLDL